MSDDDRVDEKYLAVTRRKLNVYYCEHCRRMSLLFVLQSDKTEIDVDEQKKLDEQNGAHFPSKYSPSGVFMSQCKIVSSRPG